MACRSMGIHGRVYVPAKTPKQKRDRIRYHGARVHRADRGRQDLRRGRRRRARRRRAHRRHPGAAVRRPAHHRRAGHHRRRTPRSARRRARPGGRAGRRRRLHQRASPPTSPSAPRAPRCSGVEPAGAAAMIAALADGAAGDARPRRPVRRRRRGERAGALPYAALAAAGDMVSITAVDEGAVCTAMLDLYQNEGIIAEPAGALSVAALLEADVAPGSTVVCLISGGNNDVSRYGEVLERSLVHLGSQALLPGRLPAGARRAAAVPGRGARPGRRHHAVRVRQAQQPGDRRGARRHRTRFRGRPRRSARADEGVGHSRRDSWNRASLARATAILFSGSARRRSNDAFVIRTKDGLERKSTLGSDFGQQRSTTARSLSETPPNRVVVIKRAAAVGIGSNS